ncbi:MAG: hypothetical protein WD314_12715 [Trueperaceae bacterium]
MRQQYLALSILLFFGPLAACAPATGDGPRVEVEQLNEPVSFYPQETGATWQYLPDSARLDERRVYQRVDGPTVLDGEVVTGWHLIGRGIDEQHFRSYGQDGVFLLRTIKPGTIIDFRPAVQEFPAAGSLRLGASWGGETTASVVYPDARPEHREASLDIRYRYTVVDERNARVPAGEFTVFVIDFESVTVDELGRELERLSQTVWFSPHIGEVRTENGYFLIETNFFQLQEP